MPDSTVYIQSLEEGVTTITGCVLDVRRTRDIASRRYPIELVVRLNEPEDPSHLSSLLNAIETLDGRTFPDGVPLAIDDEYNEGTSWIRGPLNPSDDTGRDGAFYLNTTTNSLFRKANGAWVLEFRSLNTSQPERPDPGGDVSQWVNTNFSGMATQQTQPSIRTALLGRTLDAIPNPVRGDLVEFNGMLAEYDGHNWARLGAFANLTALRRDPSGISIGSMRIINGVLNFWIGDCWIPQSCYQENAEQVDTQAFNEAKAGSNLFSYIRTCANDEYLGAIANPGYDNTCEWQNTVYWYNGNRWLIVSDSVPRSQRSINIPVGAINPGANGTEVFNGADWINVRTAQSDITNIMNRHSSETAQILQNIRTNMPPHPARNNLRNIVNEMRIDDMLNDLDRPMTFGIPPNGANSVVVNNPIGTANGNRFWDRGTQDIINRNWAIGNNGHAQIPATQPETKKTPKKVELTNHERKIAENLPNTAQFYFLEPGQHLHDVPEPTEGDVALHNKKYYAHNFGRWIRLGNYSKGKPKRQLMQFEIDIKEVEHLLLTE